MIGKMKKGKSILGFTAILFAGSFLISGCNQVNQEKKISELIETDLAFSEMSSDKGVKRAFESYISSDEAISDGLLPIDAKNVVLEQFRNCSDSGYVLSWKPLGANIVSSGNIGYTYGIYQIASIDTVTKGTYVTVWKKTKEGNWKFMLDIDNKDLGKIN